MDRTAGIWPVFQPRRTGGHRPGPAPFAVSLRTPAVRACAELMAFRVFDALRVLDERTLSTPRPQPLAWRVTTHTSGRLKMRKPLIGTVLLPRPREEKRVLLP